MNIVYFGSDVFLSCFTYFLEHHRITALYTYHHDEDYMTEENIVRAAGEHKIPVHYGSITEDRIRQLFLEEGCGMLFAAEYDRRIPVPADLDCFRGVNVHSSLLPEGRSYYPIEAAMERSLSRTGVTIHKLAPALDCGDILAQRELAVTPDMDSVDVYLELGALALSMTEEIMQDPEAAWHRARPQDGKSPYWTRPAADRLTLSHALTRDQARQMFGCFNCMTQVNLGGILYYIRALNTGPARLPLAEWRLDKDLVLYALADGHARLIVHRKSEEDRR